VLTLYAARVAAGVVPVSRARGRGVTARADAAERCSASARYSEETQMANVTTESSVSEQEGGSQQESAGLSDRLAKTTNDATSATVERLQHARERFDKRLVEQRSSIAQRVRAVSRVLDGGGKMLGDDEFGARCLHYASEKLDRVASYVEQVEPSTITEDLRNVARDQPAWFFGSAFTLGLALGRFAHSTAASVAGASAAADDEEKTAGSADLEQTPSAGAFGPKPAKQVASRRPAVSARADRAAGGTGSASGGPQGAQALHGSTRPRGPTSGQP
jgi:hypothetical protein